jgi:SPX domain protein involved in polyphosphate accumulation
LISEWKEKYIDYDHLKRIIDSINSVHHYNNDPNIPITSHFDRNRSLVVEEKEFLVQLSLEVRKVEEFYFFQLNEAKKKELLLVSQLQQLEKYHNGKTVAVAPLGKNNDKISGYREELGEKEEVNDVEKAITWTRSMNHFDETKEVPQEEKEEEDERNGDYLENQEVFQLDDEEKHLKEDLNDDDETVGNHTTKLPWRSYVSQYLLQNNPRIAKAQLRKAFIEFYRFLELLKSFRDLNIMAYKKIVKKFDKNSRLNLKEPLIEELSASSFYRSNDLTDLMAIIEERFRLFFIEDKNRALAMKALRTIGINPIDINWNFTSSRLPYSIFLAGISFGIGTMLIILISLYMTSLSEPKPRRKNILAIIYFGFGFPLLDAILIGINMHVWDRYKINYRLIFGLNPRTSTIAYFSFVSSLGLLYLILVSIGLFGRYNDSLPISGQVWLTLGIIATLSLSYICFYYIK